MRFWQRFLRNIGLLALGIIVLYFVFPQIFEPGYQVMWAIGTPLIILLLALMAIPNRR